MDSWNIGRILRWTEGFFSERGILSARLDAEVLLADLLGCDRISLYVNYDRPLSADELAGYRQRVKRRAAREPVAYITGKKEFYRLEFLVTPDVLIPRPETELLVEQALKYLTDIRNASVLDIGTGSGAIALSIAHGKADAEITATDLSKKALSVAENNAYRFSLADRVRFIVSDWYSSVPEGKYDLIVSNPPYIERSEKSSLQPELGYEPESALFDITDGLQSYRELLSDAKRFLKPGGKIMLECGAGQAQSITGIAGRAGWSDIAIVKDFAGIERIVIISAAE